MIKFDILEGPRFDYVNTGNPTININLRVPYASWVNLTTGEIFICIDTTPDVNVWVGQRGTTISYYSPPTAGILRSFASPLPLFSRFFFF